MNGLYNLAKHAFHNNLTHHIFGCIDEEHCKTELVLRQPNHPTILDYPRKHKKYQELRLKIIVLHLYSYTKLHLQHSGSSENQNSFRIILQGHLPPGRNQQRHHSKLIKSGYFVHRCELKGDMIYNCTNKCNLS